MKDMAQENIFDPPFAYIGAHMGKLQPKTCENPDFGVGFFDPCLRCFLGVKISKMQNKVGMSQNRQNLDFEIIPLNDLQKVQANNLRPSKKCSEVGKGSKNRFC